MSACKRESSSSRPENCQAVAESKDSDDLERAKQWTYYIETLKRTIDCIYEICRKEQTVNGCKEALMYLSSSAHDFESLIKTINMEVAWEEENKPHAVAWEIRKTVAAPGKTVGEGQNKKDADTLINMLKLSPIVVHGVVESTEEKLKTKSPVPSPSSSLAAAVVGSEIPDKESHKKEAGTKDTQGDDEWHLVMARHKRRKSIETESSQKENKESIGVRASAKGNFMNVYERLSSGVLRPPNSLTRTPVLSESGGRGLMYPRSAMDLPQTKASMAKVAYCRQLLWKKQQSDLAEKMKRRRRQLSHCTRKADSLPTLSAINFADPDAVSRSAAAFRNRKKLLKKDGSTGGLKERNTPPGFERIEEIPSENDEERENIPTNLDTPIAVDFNGKYLNCSRSEPPLSELILPDDIDEDDTWRAMTEEEESLVQEEQSLKKEIEEEESISIDDELERQVAAQAAALEQREIEKAEKKQRAEEVAKEEMSKKTTTVWEEIINNLKQEMEVFASLSWSEIVEREIACYRRPGEFAERHEKLSSPSRKRNTESATKRQEERQKRAEELRQMLQEQKARRLQELSNKVEEVRRKRAELNERKSGHLQMRMAKAEENRQKNIEEIVKKARDDDVKVREVQFINTIEADNMRHDVMARNQEWEQRAQSIAIERAKKNEEKAAKEAAAEERRKIAENQRIEKIRGKFERQEILEAQRNEQERERTEAARERNKQLNERAAEKKATEAVESQRLMKKIQKKQEETRRRYENTLKQVKDRAVELSSPRPTELLASLADFSHIPSETSYMSASEGADGESSKKCKLCDIMKAQIEQNTDDVIVEPNRQMSLGGESQNSKQSVNSKKRRTRLRQKIQAKTKEYESIIDGIFSSKDYQAASGKSSIDRFLRDITNVVKETVGNKGVMERCNGLVKEILEAKVKSSTDLHTLERSLSEILRSLRTANTSQKRDSLLKAVSYNNFVDILATLISCTTDGDTVTPSRTYCKALSTLGELVTADTSIATKFFFTDRIFSLLDSFCIKSKIIGRQFLNQPSSGTSASESCERLLIECVMLCSTISCIIGALYTKNNESVTSHVPIASITDDDLYLKLLLSYLQLNGYTESLLMIIKHSGSNKLPWSVHLDSNAVVIPVIVYIDLISDLGEVTHLLLAKRRVNKTVQAKSEKFSFIANVAPAAIQYLAAQIYSMISSERSSPIIVSIVAGSGCREEVEVSQIMATYLFQLWFLLLKREPHLAKNCSEDSELCLRLVFIIVTMVRQSERAISSNTESSKSNQNGRRMTNFLHFLIEIVGYFAMSSVRAKMFCVFGWQRSLLMQLASLPLGYFSNQDLMAILIPTLIAICYQNPLAVDLIKPSLSPKTFSVFLEASKNGQFEETARFPEKLWSNAINFFNAC